jgi:hypothetical protein
MVSEERSNKRLLDILTVWGSALAVGAFFGWVIDKFLPEKVTFSPATVSVGLSIFLALLLGSILQLRMSWPGTSLQRPRILLFKPGVSGLFVLSPVDWLAYGFVYTLFVAEDDGFERSLGVAKVHNIQNDKKIQIAVLQKAMGAEAVWKSLDSGSKDYFGKIIIKPGALLNG